MKKITAIILTAILCLSVTAGAVEPYIEWLDIENVTDVHLLDNDRFEIVVNNSDSALCTSRGELLTEFEFNDIRRVSDNLYRATSNNIFDTEKPLYALDKNGNILEAFTPEPLSLMRLPGEKTEIDILEFEKNNINFYHSYGHYAIAHDADRNIVLADLNGNTLNELKYNDTRLLSPYLTGKIMLNSDEHGYAVIADPYHKRFLDKVLRSSLRTYPNSLVYLNDNNKYSVAVFDTLEAKPEEYDEFICATNGHYAFEKDGLTYVTDEYGNVTYSGKRAVRIAAYDSYVIDKNGKLGIFDKNFNEIFPCEYENADIIARDLYILKKDDKYKLIGQGKELISGKSIMNRMGNYICTEDAVYDAEGAFVAELEGYTKGFYTNCCYTYYSEEKQRIGRLVDESSKPVVEINGSYMDTDTLPRIKNNITLVPLRALAEKTGFEVSYNADIKEISLTKGESEIKFTVGKTECFANGKKISLEAAPEIINNRTLVPVRAISDAFGYSISWDGERRLVEVNTTGNAN